MFPENREMALDWFEFWLKGVDNGIMDTPPVRAYVMGPGIATGGSARPALLLSPPFRRPHGRYDTIGRIRPRCDRTAA
jgi:hypothetical protein